MDSGQENLNEKNKQYSFIDIIIDLYVCLCQNHEKSAFYNKNYNIQI